MRVDSNPIEDLMDALPGKFIEIGKDVNDKYTVQYTNGLGEAGMVKDDPFCLGVCGRGKDIFEAAEDYMQKISGKTLVLGSGTQREEITVMFIVREHYRYY